MKNPMITIIFLLLLYLLLSVSPLHSETVASVYDPVSFGAKADGETVDTAAIQQAVDRAAAEGGGTVLFQRGTYVSGTIILKSNVTLRFEKGAVLKASDEIDDFPIMESKHRSYSGPFVTNRMLIYAEDAENISIVGEGTLDGNSPVLYTKYKGSPNFQNPSFSFRPRIVHFRGCRNVRISDMTLKDSASWTMSLQSCSGMRIEGIRIRCRKVVCNADGIDLIDCQRVRIANCDIESGDDAICFKSFSTEEKCSDIAIANCLLSASSSGIKIGTETVGGFEDITISNCVIFDTDGDGIALLSADGACLQRINISNIVLRNVRQAPIVLRLGARDRLHREEETSQTGILKDIIISNVQGSGLRDFACSITGVPGRTIENVTFRDINLEFEGNGKREATFRKIPENEKSYPSGRCLGVFPAYGLYVRHAKNVVLDNVQFRFKNEDQRPALVGDGVESFRIRNPFFQCSPEVPGLIRFHNVRDTVISGATARNETPLFLYVSGEQTGKITLCGNHSERGRNWFDAETDAIRTRIEMK